MRRLMSAPPGPLHSAIEEARHFGQNEKNAIMQILETSWKLVGNTDVEMFEIWHID